MGEGRWEMDMEEGKGGWRMETRWLALVFMCFLHLAAGGGGGVPFFPFYYMSLHHEDYVHVPRR
jgi:hypothetical protein